MKKHYELKVFLENNFHPSWIDGVLENHLYSQYFYELGQKLNEERANHVIYPSTENIFRAFRLTPFNTMRGVILGQDPYHDGSADGLCFSNSLTDKISPSLNNVLKELSQDKPDFVTTKDLSCWAEQGLLMLNTVLTVRKGEPNSHANLWKIFTTTILQEIAFKKNNLVWMMWGNQAQRYKDIIFNCTHGFVCTSHPSPLGANHGEIPFMGSRCFTKFNNELIKRNIDPIIW